MARAPRASVPRGGRADQPLGWQRLLRRWLLRELQGCQPHIRASAAACQAERYRKHLTAFAHTCLLLFHGFTGYASLRQSYATFAAGPGLVALSGLAAPTVAARFGGSFSQFAASNTSRPAAGLAGLIPPLLTRVRALGPAPGLAWATRLPAVDSTFLRLSLKLAPGLPSRGGRDVPGVRVHLQYAPLLDWPEQVLLTDTRTNDGLAFDRLLGTSPERLAARRDHTFLIDLGYYSHRRFAPLRAAGVHWVTRR